MSLHKILLPVQQQPPKVFNKKGVVRNFAIFTGKQLCWNLFSINLHAFRKHISMWKHIFLYFLSLRFHYVENLEVRVASLVKVFLSYLFVAIWYINLQISIKLCRKFEVKHAFSIFLNKMFNGKLDDQV